MPEPKSLSKCAECGLETPERICMALDGHLSVRFLLPQDQAAVIRIDI